MWETWGVLKPRYYVTNSVENSIWRFRTKGRALDHAQHLATSMDGIALDNEAVVVARRGRRGVVHIVKTILT
jgi:hypothetical protein